MQVKKLIRDYLVFTRKDRLGVIALLVMVALIVALPYLTAPKQNSFPGKETVLLIQELDSAATADSILANTALQPQMNSRTGAAPAFVKGELFTFDPNTLPAEGWQRLGLNQKTAAVIDNYRNKGGKFYKAEDLKKIWGMPDGFYERVKDYIVIRSTQKYYPRDQFQKTAFTRSENKALVVNVNQASADELIELPGIGSTLANRIIKFRENLGGFYSVEQVGQVYGLPDSTFQKIKGSLQLSGSVKTLNVNTATKDELKLHPYISWNLANAIVEFRNQHGAFTKLDELKKIVLMDEETFEKVVNYLSL